MIGITRIFPIRSIASFVSIVTQCLPQWDSWRESDGQWWKTMSLSLNKPKLDNLTDDIWKSAERLRGKFKAYEYQNVGQ